MGLIRKININNNRILTISKEGEVYYSWVVRTDEKEKLDPYMITVVTKELYSQLLEDFSSGLIKYVYDDFPTKEDYLENLSDQHVLNIINWFSHAYMTWDNDFYDWIYGRNENYMIESNNYKQNLSKNRIIKFNIFFILNS